MASDDCTIDHTGALTGPVKVRCQDCGYTVYHYPGCKCGGIFDNPPRVCEGVLLAV